jgi:hypothetical protein
MSKAHPKKLAKGAHKIRIWEHLRGMVARSVIVVRGRVEDLISENSER